MADAPAPDLEGLAKRLARHSIRASNELEDDLLDAAATLRLAAVENARLREALKLIVEMDGDQPARTEWNMLHIARAAWKGGE